MAFLFLIAFIAVPLVEISVFIEVGGRIGLWPTVGIVILTAVIGTAMLRQQGISVLFRIQENLQANRLPVRELFDGVCLVIAGVLLLTPGFVTDALGFVLFIPPLRGLIATWLGARVIARADFRYGPDRQGPGMQGPDGFSAQSPGQTHGRTPGGGPIIDGEFQDVTPDDNDTVADGNRRLGGNDNDPNPR